MTLHRAAGVIAAGFLAASAITNFMFAFALAKSPLLAGVYGSVGVLATAANAVIPLRMLQAWEAKRIPVLVAGAILLPLCIAFSLTSAMGFAATVRDTSSADRAALSQNYKTTLTMLKELEAKPRTAKTAHRGLASRVKVVPRARRVAAGRSAIGSAPDHRHHGWALSAHAVVRAADRGRFRARLDHRHVGREGERASAMETAHRLTWPDDPLALENVIIPLDRFELVLRSGTQRRSAMATYIMLANFTDQGIRNVKDSVKRAEAFKELAIASGVTVKDLYWTLGQYDIVAIADAPDEMTVTALGLALGKSGNVRTQTLRAFTASDMTAILSKVA